MEKTNRNWRGFTLGLVVVLIFSVYVLRLVDWQLVKGDAFLQKANRTSTSTVKMDAARGEIVDINGNPLAANKTGYAVEFSMPYMTNDNKTRNATIQKLIKLLAKRGEVWEDVLPIELAADGSYRFKADSEKEIKTLKSKDFLDVNSYATAAECMTHLIEKYEVEGYSAADTRNILSVRYGMSKSGFSVSQPYTFAKDVSVETVGIIQENAQLLPGASVKITTMRSYPDGSMMPHILGTIGSISQEEYDKLKDNGYAFNDRLGKSGIEQAYESDLRGKDGTKVVETTSTGALASETVTQAPVPGKTVFLTLDNRIQKVAQISLANNVKGAQENGARLTRQRGYGNNGEDCVAGGVVALRISDFSVLAAATFPTYDMNAYTSDSSYYSSLIQDKNRPLVNRAFNGIFTPGSIFKPNIAAAALQEGSITNSTNVYCGHVYQRFADTGFKPTCLGYHGNITLRRAIAESCNIYFFEAGYHLGITNMNLYSKKFGLGVKTGIELSESVGTLAGPEQSTKTGKTWVGGDTVQAAIGQSDNQFTPVQLATYVATIAKDGERDQTHLVRKVTDYARKTVYEQNDPSKANKVEDVGVSKQNFQYVKDGMRYVITDPKGSAHSQFGNYGIAIAGKTGTAQTPKSDNVSFIGYAPYDNPQIALAVVLEHGGSGRFSQQVAKDIFDAYFFGKYVDASGNLVMPSQTPDSANSALSSAASSGVSSAPASSAQNTPSSASSAAQTTSSQAAQ